MKNLFLWMFVAALLGTTVAWSINYKRFGHRDAHFGPFSTETDEVPTKIIASLRELQESVNARVEVANETTFDFGTMAPGTEGSHSFVIRSVGEDDLTLKLGATTCKCTLGELAREALAPGEETEITLTWKVQGAEREFQQSAQVITNDPTRPAVHFEIVGRIVSELDVVPETWTFGEVATGEPIEFSGKVYNFSDNDIELTDLRFSSEEMNELASFEVEPFKPTKEADGIHGTAREGFDVTARLKPGLRQGSVSQNLIMGFLRLDKNNQPLPAEEGDDDPVDYIYASTKGRIVGSLSMLPNSKITGQEGGGYLFDAGEISADDPLVVKTFVVLKGDQRDNTELTVGKTAPEGVVSATLGEPKGRGSMKLYPLEIEFTPGKETIERLGKNSEDYGLVTIDSDNPKVTSMRIGLKFSLEGR